MSQRKDEILVEVKGVGKKFSRNLKRSLFYGLKDIAASLTGGGGKARSDLRKEEFWAVKDVSFSLKRGECLGLIGHNGAGKSTLLKMLNGLIRPDEGSITMRGRICALIELGTGFNPVLSGRENIYINGQILGFTKKEVDAKLDSIIEFSELGEFIDSPVQSYSSGMKVRLGFAVAAQMEPDVLILDEVLAVGDVGFRGKCMKVISEMMNKAAVIFVSHSMPVVGRYCNRGILLTQGTILKDSHDIHKVIDAYLTSFDKNKNTHVYAAEGVELVNFTSNNFDLKKGSATVELFESAVFDIKLKIPEKRFDSISIKLNFINRDLTVIAATIIDPVVVAGEFLNVQSTIGPFTFQPGPYKISFVAFTKEFTEPILIHESLYEIKVAGKKDYGGNSVVLRADNNIHWTGKDGHGFENRQSVADQ